MQHPPAAFGLGCRRRDYFRHRAIALQIPPTLALCTNVTTHIPSPLLKCTVFFLFKYSLSLIKAVVCLVITSPVHLSSSVLSSFELIFDYSPRLIWFRKCGERAATKILGSWALPSSLPSWNKNGMAAKALRPVYNVHECLDNFQMPASKNWRLSFSGEHLLSAPPSLPPRFSLNFPSTGKSLSNFPPKHYLQPKFLSSNKHLSILPLPPASVPESQRCSSL